MEKAVFSQQDIADRWDCGINTVRRWEDKGKLHRLVNLPGVKYSAKEVMELESLGPEVEGLTAWERKRLENKIAEQDTTIKKLMDRLCKIQQLSIGERL